MTRPVASADSVKNSQVFGAMHRQARAIDRWRQGLRRKDKDDDDRADQSRIVGIDVLYANLGEDRRQRCKDSRQQRPEDPGINRHYRSSR
jgi:hypothetical protein